MKTLFGVLLALFGLMGSLAASAAGEIQLLRAQSSVSYAEGLHYQQPTIDALVANLGYTKQVSVHLLNAQGVWVDIPLSYSRPAGAGYELWSANRTAFDGLLGYSTLNLTFALKYVVNGQTYWDNNGGKNYSVAADSGSYLPVLNVYNSNYQAQVYASQGGPYIYGTVTVRNIAYAKQITVIYSTDNWVTTQTAVATYSPNYWLNAYSSASNPNQYGFEEWTFGINTGTATKVQYAIAYAVNGQTYWDNNFGQNYSVTISQ